jgi:hypothetical protein
MDFFSQTFEQAIPQLRKEMLAAFSGQQTQSGFRSVWEHFEEIINPILIRFLTQAPLSIPEANITVAKSKSTYPDLKILFRGNLYAIDVKSGEDKTDPWYDIGRLDTYQEKRLDKYADEFSVVVRWKGRKPSQVVNVYIEPVYRTVGFKESADGILYRPYDGKLRPKPWVYFDQGKSFWKDKEHFKQGFAASKNFRQKSYILEWYRGMDEAQRLQVRKDLDAVDKGVAVKIDEDILKDEPAD